jgi:hypothetical protein
VRYAAKISNLTGQERVKTIYMPTRNTAHQMGDAFPELKSQKKTSYKLKKKSNRFGQR